MFPFIVCMKRNNSMEILGAVAKRRRRFGCILLAGAVAMALGSDHDAASAQTTPSLPGYSLVYQDNFSTDSYNTAGELKNVKNSSSMPTQPDWMYRAGTGGDCVLGTSANVYLAPDRTGTQALTLADIASAPSTANSSDHTTLYYQNYNCGGLLSTRWLGYGYYETYADISTGTNGRGFHTSFWKFGGYQADEWDVFENDSHYNYIGPVTYTQGIYEYFYDSQTMLTDTAAVPSPHITINNTLAPHTYGVLVQPNTLTYYKDGVQTYSTAFAGPYMPNTVDFTSIGSTGGAPTPGHAAGSWNGSWIPYDGSNASLTFPFSFQYFHYYQPTTMVTTTVPVPSNAIFIDRKVPTGLSSTFSPHGTWSNYTAGVDSNTNVTFGPLGYLGQNAVTSQTPGDQAVWSHTFSSTDAGSYDVYLWNAATAFYQMPNDYEGQPDFAPDAAQDTTYVLAGSAGAAPASQGINQSTAGQQWVPVNSSGPSTNTYLFTGGSVASITLTVGAESSTSSPGGVAFTPHTNADSVVFIPVHTVGISPSAPDSYTESGMTSSGLVGWPGSGAAQYSTRSGDPTATATWSAGLPSAGGSYAIYVYVPSSSSSSTTAYYVVYDGSTPLANATVNQVTQSGQWVQIGTAPVTFSGTTATITVTNGIAGSGANGFLRTNAIKLVPQALPTYVVCTNSKSLYGTTLFSTSVGTWTSGTSSVASPCGTSDQLSTSSGATATFAPQVPVAGLYHAYVFNDSNLTPSATKVIVAAHASSTMICNALSNTGSSHWIYLGDYYFGPDVFPNTSGVMTTDTIQMKSTTAGTIAANAIQLVYATSPGDPTKQCTNTP